MRGSTRPSVFLLQHAADGGGPRNFQLPPRFGEGDGRFLYHLQKNKTRQLVNAGLRPTETTIVYKMIHSTESSSNLIDFISGFPNLVPKPEPWQSGKITPSHYGTYGKLSTFDTLSLESSVVCSVP